MASDNDEVKPLIWHLQDFMRLRKQIERSTEIIDALKAWNQVQSDVIQALLMASSVGDRTQQAQKLLAAEDKFRNVYFEREVKNEPPN